MSWNSGGIFLLLIHDILKNSFLWDCGAVSISWYYSGAIFFRFVLLLILDLNAIGYWCFDFFLTSIAEPNQDFFKFQVFQLSSFNFNFTLTLTDSWLLTSIFPLFFALISSPTSAPLNLTLTRPTQFFFPVKILRACHAVRAMQKYWWLVKPQAQHVPSWTS